MGKSSFQSTFIPAQTSLLNSIQRAKQRIFSKSTRQQQTGRKTLNDQNNSLSSNVKLRVKDSFIDKIKQSRRVALVDSNDKQVSRKENTKQSQIKRQKSTSQLNHSPLNVATANVIKLLQQKINQLQGKNRQLEEKLTQSRIQSRDQNFTLHKKKQLSTIYKPQSSDLKSYGILKQQCQTLQKQNISLYQQLSKRKEPFFIKKQSGHKLNFHHQVSVSQNISNVFQTINNEHQEKSEKIKQLQEKLNKFQEQSTHYRASLQLQRKKNFAILRLHQEEIIKNQQLSLQLIEIKARVRQLQQQLSQQRKDESGRQSNTRRSQQYQSSQLQRGDNRTSTRIRQGIIRRNNCELQKALDRVREQLKNERTTNTQKQKEVAEIQRRYIQVKEVFIELYRDLTKYHPEVISSNIKFLYDRVRKGEEFMGKSNSILGNRFGRLSNTKRNTSNALSAFRSRSGKKGLKMQDLNSSKRSHSRERTNSKNSNCSNSKSNYRSPYAQQNLTKRNRLKSALSPSQKQRHRSSTALPICNKAKLSQIQKIIIQIKQVSKQIKTIKTEHRNLSVKFVGNNQLFQAKNNQANKNQQRMNELIQQYNERSAKILQLKQQKDRLALETVPDALM